MRYEFQVPIVVDGTPYRAGDQVEAGEIPAGCLASLRRLGQVAEVASPAPPPAAPPPPAPARPAPPPSAPPPSGPPKKPAKK